MGIGGAIAGSTGGAQASDAICDTVEDYSGDVCESCQPAEHGRKGDQSSSGGQALGGGGGGSSSSTGGARCFDGSNGQGRRLGGEVVPLAGEESRSGRKPKDGFTGASHTLASECGDTASE